MAQWRPCRSEFAPFLHSRQHAAIPISFISKSQIPTSLTSQNSSFLSVTVSVSRFYRYPTLQCTASGSSSSNSIEFDTNSYPQIGVFIKALIGAGLPGSMTADRLKEAFSQFGEIVLVQVVIEKVSKQPLGSAFVWFTCKESVDLAVEKMNGKFFDGRFILVKVAEPGMSKNRGRRRIWYKF